MKESKVIAKKINIHFILILSMLIFIILIYVVIFNCIEALSFYSGFPYGSYFGSSGYTFGLGSNAIYGTTGIPGLPLGSLFNQYSSLSGLGGIGGLYGLYGGLYGGSLYSSLYGLGGLYGGVYGGLTGGLYGGLYGGLGLLGPGGLYGGLGTLGLGGGLYGLGALADPLFFAAQVGTWTGTWTNFILSGLMTLNLAEDPITGALYGYAQLLGNTYLDALVEVTGEVLNSQIFVAGSGTGLGNQNFTVEIIGTLIATDIMTGVYNMINNSSGGTITEQGSFNLQLVTPVI